MSRLKRLVSVILCLALVSSIAVAGSGSASAAAKILGTLTINVGESQPLKLTDPNGNKASVTWSTENSSIASVTADGMVTGKKAGTTVVKTVWNSAEYGVNIKVLAVKKATSKKIALNKTKASLTKGSKVTLKLKNAKAKSVKWKSSNKKVAKVSKGKVKALKNGTAKITAKYKKKTYKCTVRVFTVKKLGTKKVTESKNSATISKVKISFDPSLLKNSAKVTLKKAGGLPKLNGIKMKTFDFSLSGVKVNKNNVAVIEIPQKVKSGEMPVAGYFNETTQKWEPVCCDYKNGKISIVTNHFSLHGVAAVKKDRKWNVYNENTTMQKAMSYWAPTSATISGEEALQIVSQTLKKGSVPTKCVEWGWDKVNELFDSNVNWKANLFGALGISTKVTDFINDNTAEFGAIGFALAYINAIKYAYEGDHKQAAYTAFNGYSGAVVAAVASKLGTAAISAGCFAITVISYALTKGYEQALSGNEKKWYTYYRYYYSHENPRKPHDWKDILLPILENKDKHSMVKVQKDIEAEIDKYVAEAWSSEWFSYYFYESTGLNFGVAGGISKEIMNKLSAEYKNELLNGDVGLVYEWYQRKLKNDAENAMEEAGKKLAEELNREFTISFYDGSLKKGKKSSLAGWTVRWKKIPNGIKDKKNLSLTLNSQGKASTEYTLFAAVDYRIKPEVELVNPKGKVKKTIKYTIKSGTTKINLNPKKASTKNKWNLTSAKSYSIGLYGYYPDKNTYNLGGSYSDSSVKYSFSVSGNSITTTQTRLDTDETETCTHTASVSQPASVLTPGEKLTLTETLKLESKSKEFVHLSSPSVWVKCSGVNPELEDNPKYAWTVASVGTYAYSMSVSAGLHSNQAGTTKKQSTTFTIPAVRKKFPEEALKSGDVFYIYLHSKSDKCNNYIVYTYTYK